MANSFSAEVDKWVLESKNRLEAIAKQSIQTVIQTANTPTAKGGRMRVDTGFLRNSGIGSLSSMPGIDRNAKPAPGQTYTYDRNAIALVIAGARMGQTIYYGYTAAYAEAREVGARGQPPDAFVRLAAQQWPRIVSQTVKEAKARS